MSGASLPDSDVVSFSTRPVHCWRSSSTVTLGWILAYSAIAYSTSSSGVSVPFSQRRIVSASSPAPPAVVPGASVPAAVVAADASVSSLSLSSPPHAPASSPATASAPNTRIDRFLFTVVLPIGAVVVW
jgi:hypothetical protein